MLSMKGHYSFDDAEGIQGTKQSPMSCSRTTIDKAMQTDVSMFRSKSFPTADAEFQMSLSDHTVPADGYLELSQWLCRLDLDIEVVNRVEIQE